MSKLGLVVLLSFLSGRTLSQDYFVFIGSDHPQPFYVRIDSQVYSSSAAGHLLLAPLKDSDYILTIGFPGQTWPERRYGFSMRGKDHDFGLRWQDDGGWRLYDEMGQHWVTALEKENGAAIGLTGVKKDDAFSRMMAGVVHDTAVLYNTFAMEEAPKDSPVVAAGRKVDSPVIAAGRKIDSPVVAARMKIDSPVAPRADSARTDSGASGASAIVKLSEKRSSHSVRLVYADRKDTKVVIIPKDTGTKVQSGRARSADIARRSLADTARKTTIDTLRKAPVDTARMKASLDTARMKPRLDSVRKTTPDTARKAANAIAFINSDCHNFATDYDVDRLRVKMLDAARDDDRIAAARKVFKTKCFYTHQIRALSEVFNSDAGKFRFFEAAWPFAADEHFGELSALLTDPVYIGKFRTMTGAQP